MSKKSLFKTYKGSLLPSVDTKNNAGGSAYSLEPKTALAQILMTGTFNGTYYSSEHDLLNKTIELCAMLDDQYLAKAAIYARRKGKMKDLPSFIVAYLGVKTSDSFGVAFDRVIDNGKMLRNFFQMVRSGMLGRKSFGRRMLRAIHDWFDNASDRRLINAYIGNSPTLKDIIVCVNPDRDRSEKVTALRKYLKNGDISEDLPTIFKNYELLKKGGNEVIFDKFPFQLLCNSNLSVEQWKNVALNMPFNTLRMNLNMLANKGIFEEEYIVEKVCAKLKDKENIQQSFPYQLYMTFCALESNVPMNIKIAIQEAIDLSFSSLNILPKNILIGVDVSGSMDYEITGDRGSATTKVKCIDVASLIACAYLKNKPNTRIIAFSNRCLEVNLNPLDSVTTNTKLLTSLLGGGTDCSIPYRYAVQYNLNLDLVILVSDNESWLGSVDDVLPSVTAQMVNKLISINPSIKFVNINIASGTTTQLKDSNRIMNIGGFSDEVFNQINRFYYGYEITGEDGESVWVKEIESIDLNEKIMLTTNIF